MGRLFGGFLTEVLMNTVLWFFYIISVTSVTSPHSYAWLLIGGTKINETLTSMNGFIGSLQDCKI